MGMGVGGTGPRPTVADFEPAFVAVQPKLCFLARPW
jgi:hypothetical protein